MKENSGSGFIRSKEQVRRHSNRGAQSRAAHRPTDAPTSPSPEARGSGRRRGRRIAAGVAATVVLGGGAALVVANIGSEGSGLAAQEEARLLKNLGLKDALETGQEVNVRVAPLAVELSEGAVYRTTPPTSVETNPNVDAFAERTTSRSLLTRPIILRGSGDEPDFLMALPEGAESLTEARYYPLDSNNAAHMQFWGDPNLGIEDGTVRYGDFVYADSPGATPDAVYGGLADDNATDLNQSVGVTLARQDGGITSTVTSDGVPRPAFTLQEGLSSSDIIAQMAELGFQPYMLDPETFPEGPTIPKSQ